MSITTQELADLVGVSRGTVDRVLNNRGRVSPHMKQRIEEAARQHGYVPAAMGRALARAKNPVKIGALIHLARLPFAKEILAGLHSAKEDLAQLGGVVLIETVDSLDAEAHSEALERLLEQEVQGLAVTPIEDEAFKSRLARAHEEQGVEIVTLNTDSGGIPRSCFVGLDNFRSGQTAAGLIHMMLGKTGGPVLIVSGTLANKTNSQRVDGFLQVLEEKHPEVQVPGIQFSQDDEETAHRVVAEALAATPRLAAIYMVSGGQAGACRALEEAGRSGEVHLVVHDTIPETIEYIKKGVIDVIIDQNAFQQGSLPPRILFDSLFAGKKPAGDHHYTEISIKTLYNL